MTEFQMIKKYGILNAFVIGGLLGDLHIQKIRASTQKSRLRFCHGIKQIEYIKWKYNLLKAYTPDRFHAPFGSWEVAVPHTETLNDRITGGGALVSRQGIRNMREVRFYTYYDAQWTEYHNIWYQQIPPVNAWVLYRKIIPENIVEILVDPLSLLVWYYDDGSKRLDCDGARIATHSWTKTENILLQNCLLKNFN
jgi:hypothetical protein